MLEGNAVTLSYPRGPVFRQTLQHLLPYRLRKTDCSQILISFWERCTGLCHQLLFHLKPSLACLVEQGRASRKQEVQQPLRLGDIVHGVVRVRYHADQAKTKE